MDEDQCASDVVLEDGELSSSSNDVYTPLQRPSNPAGKPNPENVMNMSDNEGTCIQQSDIVPEESSDDKEDESDTSSTGSMKNILKQNKVKKCVKRSMMIRLPATDANQRARFKKNNIWTETLQEETLSENFRNIEFNMSKGDDRNVENYDFSKKYHLDGGNSLKRRFSKSSDGSNDEQLFAHKRHRPSLKKQRGSSSREQSDDSNASRHIPDLVDNILEMEPLDLARDIAEKLLEEKYDLIGRVIDVAGKEIPMELYKRTQSIEADGGMMIKNGKRRRTPGGVFLFLLKNDDRLTDDDKKLIFKENQKPSRNSRDRKVQKLKQRLCEQKSDLPQSRSELIFTNDEDMFSNNNPTCSRVSNPPPSPVGNE